jgi:DNA modification methylase
MQIKCLYDELVSVNELKPHPKNRNKHPEEQIPELAEILKYQGWRYPIKVSKLSGYITSGHGRLLSAKYNKWEKVPVNFQDYDSEEQEYADVQADNAIASWAELDLSGINLDIGDLGPDFDIKLLGIKDFVIEPAEKYDESKEDDVPEVQEQAQTVKGDVWILGNHRLVCGDSTVVIDVDKLMNGEKADMVFTDPPYGINVKNTRGEIKNDSSLDVYKKFIPSILSHLNEKIHCYYFFGSKLCYETLQILKEYFDQTNILIMPITNQTQPYPEGYFSSNYEMCFFTNYKGIKKHNTGIIEVSETTKKDKRYGGDGFLKKYYALSDIPITEHNCNTVHPTQKKVSSISFYMEISSNKNDVIVDPFGGSGSTLIACEKTNRKCFMMELDEHYCDVIIKRWQDFTGKEVINENGKKYNDLVD